MLFNHPFSTVCEVNAVEIVHSSFSQFETAFNPHRGAKTVQYVEKEKCTNLTVLASQLWTKGD